MILSQKYIIAIYQNKYQFQTDGTMFFLRIYFFVFVIRECICSTGKPTKSMFQQGSSES